MRSRKDTTSTNDKTFKKSFGLPIYATLLELFTHNVCKINLFYHVKKRRMCTNDTRFTYLLTK